MTEGDHNDVSKLQRKVAQLETERQKAVEAKEKTEQELRDMQAQVRDGGPVIGMLMGGSWAPNSQWFDDKHDITIYII